MSTCVEKLSHSCGSGDGLQVFEEDGNYTGYCFACGTYVSDPYEEGSPPPMVSIKSDADRLAELDEIRTGLSSMAVPSRSLSQESLDYYGVKVGVSQRDGETPEVLYFPYTTEHGELFRYKAKLLDPKKMWSVGLTGQPVQFFGWQQAIATGGKNLYITEGETDAIALLDIFRKKNAGTEYEKFTPAIVSIPNGAGNAANFISSQMDEITRRFKDVVLVFDQDQAGKDAAASVSRVLPGVKVAELPAKDANACLMEGRVKAAYSAVVFGANRPKNTRILYGSSLVEAAKKKPEMGLSWPWQGLTDATRGIRRGETIYIGAGVKMGKSEVVNAIAAHIITEHDLPVFLIKPEEAVTKTYQMLVGKVAGRIFHDPNIEFDEKAFDLASQKVGDKALIQDVYQFVDWDVLKQDIMYAVVSEGVKDVIIDPITCFTNQMSAAEANEHLVSLSAELSAMTKDHGFTAYIFCHLKAPNNGEPHERGGKVMSHQFAGSRAMMRSANYMIGLEGNKDPELDMLERNQRRLVILEDREFGNSDIINLYWDYQTGQFNEMKNYEGN